MTLVELMVGLAIGLFLVTVMGAVYLGSKGTFNSQESVSRLQENGRFSVDALANDLRMAGFRGCPGQASGQAALNNTLSTPTSLLYDFTRGVVASHYTGSAWSPALDAALTALSPDSSGDVITIYRSSGSSWALTSEMTTGTSDLQVSTPARIATGDILVVADCAGAALFQATNANPGTSGTIEHRTGASAIVPGVSTGDLGRAYLQDATLYRMQSISYYLASSTRQSGMRSLWTYTNPAYGQPSQTVELVTGVERMAVTFGIDTNADLAADKFVTADNVTDWTQVASVRIELLLDSPESNTTTVPQSYVFGGVTVTPSDHRMRTVVSLVSSLRNTVP
jgi:type IV pilus assembly protein PilW